MGALFVFVTAEEAGVFRRLVRHAVLWFVVLGPPSTPKSTQVEGYAHAQFIPEMPGGRIGPKKE